MTYRIGWLSPLTPTSGVGAFSDAITRQFPCTFDGEAIDLTILYVGHDRLYRSPHRSIEICDGEGFHETLTLFDLLIYNMGNHLAHHDAIFALLRLHPGIVICHDHVYQQYFAGRSLRGGKSFASFAALLLTYGDGGAPDDIRRSRLTSRLDAPRYNPWDSDASVQRPMNEPILALGSAVVVHSCFAQRHAEHCFAGPVLRLGMPYDQRPDRRPADPVQWVGEVGRRQRFELVSFGHIQVTKCIDLVLSAMAASPVLRRRLHYTVAGFVCEPACLDRLKAMVTALSLEGCVTFELEVSERRLGELVACADVFANLRRPNTEGASVSLIEQLDSGKPVIVLDSGCYADLPDEAAVKLPANADAAAIGAAMEALIEDPASMPAIGRAGRAYARRWTCASYAQALLRFAFANRALLERRATVGGIRSRRRENTSNQDVAPDEAWTRDLARSRQKLTYLDRNILAVDPALILGMPNEALCTHVAHVLLGMFGDAQLDRALSRFFVRLDRRAAYWACVRFAILADAVFSDDDAARDRLTNMSPCHDTEFWSVIEALPARQCMAAAALMLARRSPKAEEISVTGLDDQDGFPKRLRIASLVRALKPAPNSSLERLGIWLEAPCAPALARSLPSIERDLECTVGSPAFLESVDLAGFYAMEVDHAWTRGHQGFLGLRLGPRPVDVHVLIRHISASPEQPVLIRLSHENAATEIEARDCVPRWLSVAVSPAAADTPVWLEVATDVTAVPANSADTRPLGLCCLRVRVTAREPALHAIVPAAAPDDAEQCADRQDVCPA